MGTKATDTIRYISLPGIAEITVSEKKHYLESILSYKNNYFFTCEQLKLPARLQTNEIKPKELHYADLPRGKIGVPNIVHVSHFRVPAVYRASDDKDHTRMDK